MDIVSATTSYDSGVYRVALTVVLDAPIDRVESILRDYERYPALDPSILEASVLQRESDDSLLLFTKLRGCSGLVCRTVHRVERVKESPHMLEADVIPEKSNVAAGNTRTVLAGLESRTEVRYQTSMQPNFWVPSWVGRPMMLRTLKDASLNMFRRIEQLAHTPP